MPTIWPLVPSTPPPYDKPEDCKGCPLYGNGKGFGFSERKGANGVGIVVESLGTNEALRGMPLQSGAPAGWMFDRVLKRGGFKREDFTFIDNVIHCQPPMNKLVGQRYEHEAIRRCSHFLDETISTTQPRAIVAMGAVPLKRLTSVSGGITRNRGFIYETPDGIPVVGSFHPSYLLPRKKEKSASKYTWVMIMDIRKALRVAEGRRKVYPQVYLQDPSVDRAFQFMMEYDREPASTTLAWDLETLYKMQMKNEQKLELEGAQPVIRISFSFRPGYAMSIPTTKEMWEKIIRPIMRMNRPKVGWNSKGFDEPIMMFQEHVEMNGVLLDAMDQFHIFQPNIERNLEFATSICTDHIQPWKHLSQSDPPFYSCVDGDATISNKLQLDEWMTQREIPEYN